MKELEKKRKATSESERELKRLRSSQTLRELITNETDEKRENGYDTDAIISCIESGADVNAIDNATGKTLINTLVMLFGACEELQIPNAWEVLETFKERGADLTQVDRHGDNMLHQACHGIYDNIKDIKELVGDAIFDGYKNQVNQNGEYPWEILLDYINQGGGEPEIDDLEYINLIIDNVHPSSFKALQNLLAIARPEFVYPNEIKDFAAAIALGHNNIVNTYQRLGYDDINRAYDHQGNTLLHMAAANDDTKLANRLIKLGAALSRENHEKKIFIDYAKTEHDWFRNKFIREEAKSRFQRNLLFARQKKTDAIIQTSANTAAADESQIATPVYRGS